MEVLDSTSLGTAQTSVTDQAPHDFRRLVCSHCGNTIVVPIYCGNRFCPICSFPRRLRVKDRLDHIIKNLIRYPDHGLSHLTLTIPNSSTVSSGCSRLVKAFRRLRATRRWKALVRGGAFVIETTGQPGKWHVHLHIVLQNVYFPQPEISASWFRLTKLYCQESEVLYTPRNAWIKRISSKNAVDYLTKYLAKSDVSEASLAEVSQGLEGFRLFQPFGEWLKILKTYVKRKYPCKKCGQLSWIPEDLYYCWGHEIDYMPELLLHDEDRGYTEADCSDSDPPEVELPF